MDSRRRLGGLSAPLAAASAAWLLLATPGDAATPDVQVNPFHDPFFQLSADLPDCAEPAPPGYTVDEMRQEEHWRVEQGNSCFVAGRCRYANSYLYDPDIAVALRAALRDSPMLRGTSVWVLVQGRVVQYFGCVSRRGQIPPLEAAARRLPDVQGTLSRLSVGVTPRPPYPRQPAR